MTRAQDAPTDRLPARVRTSDLPVQRPPSPPRSGLGAVRRSGAHPTAVGWWRPPKNRRPAAGTDEQPRHRAEPGTRAEKPATSPRGIRSSLRRPRTKRQGPRTPKERRRLAVKIVLWSVAGIVASPVLAFALGYLFFSVPNPDDAVNNQVAMVSFADGSQLARLVPEAGNRTKVPIDAVPVYVRQAVLAAEDRSFYSNPGFDVTGIARAVWNQVRGGVGGGSTITQQYVKNTLVGDEQTLWRKYKEIVLSVKISQERTKDQILGDYLNAIYFGRGAYGIQSASQAYFGKNVGDLSPAEGALLAGLIQAPSNWDPAVDPDKAVQRWNFVLDGMVGQGWLDPGSRQALQFPPTIARKTAASGVPGDSSGHIVAAVTQELGDLGITEQDLAQGGLRITTTLDPKRQADAVAAAHDALTGQPVNLRSALVAIDPATGGYLAYYGGDNGLGLDYARAQRLAGSTFKPFVVLAGLLQNPPVGLGATFNGAALPGLRNAEGAECAHCDLKQAMTVSNNVVFATLAKKVGPDAVAAAAHAAGVTAPLDDPTDGIALGNKEVSTVDLASAYATLADGGVWHQPHLVQSVVTADDTVLYQAAPDGERRFPERVARNVTEAMLDVASADGLALPGGRPVAAKTGTVQSRFAGQNNDAWMAGFTPTVSTSVWIGTDMNSPIQTSKGTPVEGKSLPGEAWREFMVDAHDDAPVEQFTPFKAIGEPPKERSEPTPAPATPDTAAATTTASAAPTGASPSAAPSGEPTAAPTPTVTPTPAGTPPDQDSPPATTAPADARQPECTTEHPCG